jgi:hypothetical protein
MKTLNDVAKALDQATRRFDSIVDRHRSRHDSVEYRGYEIEECVVRNKVRRKVYLANSVQEAKAWIEDDIRRAEANPPKAAVKQTVDAGVVTSYVQELESALGTDRFGSVYDRLKGDKRVRAVEAKEIANLFGFGTKPTKDGNLYMIWRRHQQMEVDKAKRRATAGRTAA